MLNPTASEYWNRLRDGGGELASRIEQIMASADALPVGKGFIDIIVLPDRVDGFVAGLTQLGVAIHLVTAWCHGTPANSECLGCPHGMGGPIFAAGYFSEMCERDYFEIDAQDAVDSDPFAVAARCNGLAMEYVRHGLAAKSWYSPCLVPGFWLAVPDEWERRVHRPTKPESA